MPRKGHVPKRDPIADPIYSSTLVTKFVNAMMWGGKKSTAQGIFYKCMENLQSKGGDEALKLFKKAVENAKPLLEVKTRRVGGANYQVPVEVQQPADESGDPLDSAKRAHAAGKEHAREAGQRVERRGQFTRRRN